MGENHFASTPAAVYGVVMFMAAIAYFLLQRAIIAVEGAESVLAEAVGCDWKGKLSPVMYLAAVALAFVSPWIACGIYVAVALIWLVPDRRIERVLARHKP
jgi:uncharacterized membrane protein